VESESGNRVDNFNGHVDSSDATILEVNLPCLSPGTYQVFWKVVSLDGHSTNGSFAFTIE
jgi:methionine-rich copper-binding protein CopC